MPIDTGGDYIRIRQRDPARFEKGSFRTITLSEEEGIKAVIGRLIGQKTTTVQTYLFDKDKWTLAKAKQWVREHRGKHVSATQSEEQRMVKLTATQADLDAQKARSRRYGISIREDGHVTKPGEWKDLPDSQWGDPVNYLYPVKDEAHAKNAKSRFETNKGAYDSKSRGVVVGRLNRLCRKYGLAPIGEKTERGETKKMAYLIGEIQLVQSEPAGGEKQSKRVRVPAAHFADLTDPRYGKLILDQDLFETFIDNWRNRIIGMDLAIDRSHVPEEGALAWVEDMQIEDGTLYLYANTTSLGGPLLGDVYRYASVEYNPDYVDPATGLNYGPTLLGCAATNRPVVPNQEAITVLSTDTEARIMGGEGAEELIPNTEQLSPLAQEIQQFLDELLQQEAQLTKCAIQNFLTALSTAGSYTILLQEGPDLGPTGGWQGIDPRFWDYLKRTSPSWTPPRPLNVTNYDWFAIVQKWLRTGELPTDPRLYPMPLAQWLAQRMLRTIVALPQFLLPNSIYNPKWTTGTPMKSIIMPSWWTKASDYQRALVEGGGMHYDPTTGQVGGAIAGVPLTGSSRESYAWRRILGDPVSQAAPGRTEPDLGNLQWERGPSNVLPAPQHVAVRRANTLKEEAYFMATSTRIKAPTEHLVMTTPRGWWDAAVTEAWNTGALHVTPAMMSRAFINSPEGRRWLAQGDKAIATKYLKAFGSATIPRKAPGQEEEPEVIGQAAAAARA